MATVAYTDIQTIHNPAVGTAPPAAWGDQIRTNLEFLYSPPMVKLRPDATTQSLSNSTLTPLEYGGTIEWDTDSFKTSDTVLTVPSGLGGKYLIGAGYLADSGAGFKSLSLTVDGTRVADISFDGGPNTNRAQVWITEDLAAGQTVEVEGFQATGGAANWGGSFNTVAGFFEMRWVSA